MHTFLGYSLAQDKHKSVIKTFRIPKELNEYLNDEAKKSNTTPSALASTLFTSYKERYSQFERLQLIALLPTILASFVERLSDEDLTKLGPIEASKMLAYTKHVFNQENPQDRVDYCLVNLMSTSQWFNCIRSKDSYLITHQMGEKWTIFLSSFLSSFIEMETGKKPSLLIEGNVIVLELAHML